MDTGAGAHKAAPALLFSRDRQAGRQPLNDGDASSVPHTIDLASRSVPYPAGISDDARQRLVQLSSMAKADPGSYPDVADRAAWRSLIDVVNAQILETLPMYAVAERAGVSSKTVQMGSTTAHIATPSQIPPHLADKVLFEIHGGALIFLAGEGARRGSLREAERLSMKTVSVDYRVPPDHPYPAALDDCVEAFEHLAESCGSGNVIVCGNSAGGNLAAAMVLRLRDEGKPMPAALILYTPEVDLTESGDSFNTLAGLDPILSGSLAIETALYASGADLSHPYLSPLFGDFTKGFPPTFLQCGTRDLFLSNTVRMHRALRKAGVKAQLHVWEGMPHGGFQGAPEDEEVTAEVRQFIHGIWPVRPAPGD